MSKLISSIFLMASMYAVGFFTMVYGWGVQPQNLTIIIGSYFTLLALMLIAKAIASEE